MSGKASEKSRDVLPVDGAGVAVEHAGLGKDVGPRAHRAEVMAAPPHLPQPREKALVGMSMHVEPAAHDDGRMLVDLLEIAVHHGENAVRGGDRLGVDRMHRPGIELPFGDAVGDAQGFDRRGHRHHGEFRHHDEREMLRQDLRLESEHGS